MREDILELIKKNSESRKEKKDKLINLVKRMKELRENEAVREYLNLVEQIESSNYVKMISNSDESILISSFRCHMYLIEDTNEIYLCMGAYMLEDTCDIEHGPKDIRLNDRDPRVQYKKYMDIEKEYCICVPINECEEFEASHKIIFTNNLQTRKIYRNIQKEFISTALEEGQEKACQKILNKKW